MKLFLFLFLLFLPSITLTWRPFSSSSPWNTKLPSSPPIDPNSNSMINTLAFNSFYVNIQTWSIPVYYINSSTPLHRVHVKVGIFHFFILFLTIFRILVALDFIQILSFPFQTVQNLLILIQAINTFVSLILRRVKAGTCGIRRT